MAKRVRLTAFGRWLQAEGYGPERYQALADELACTEGSIRHYAVGRAIPRPEMLRRLHARTGLPLESFLFPFGG
jgi:hypothetical protein